MKGLLAAMGQDAHIEKERSRNQEVRNYTRDFFRGAGYDVVESQTNFVFVKTGRPAEELQAACKEKGVLVGRPFEPLTDYARISLGTMEEMKRATAVFTEVLGAKAKTAA
jgi:histidinol-phosphate aminotransferase